MRAEGKREDEGGRLGEDSSCFKLEAQRGSVCYGGRMTTGGGEADIARF